MASDPPTAKSLSQLISQLIQFCEDHCTGGRHNKSAGSSGSGSGSSNPKVPKTRLPLRHFLNFLPDGSLCRILATMYKFKHELGWRRFDLSSPSRKEANLEMCTKIEEALIEHDLHVVPRIFIRKDVDKEERDQIRDIVKRHHFTLSEDESEATHIIHPSGEADGDAYCRPVFKKGEKCLVHFYRFPVRHL